MFRRSLALLMSAGLSFAQANSLAKVIEPDRPQMHPSQQKGGKGQLRAAKGKPSGAAALKRAAKKTQ